MLKLVDIFTVILYILQNFNKILHNLLGDPISIPLIIFINIDTIFMSVAHKCLML